MLDDSGNYGYSFDNGTVSVREHDVYMMKQMPCRESIVRLRLLYSKLTLP